MSIDIRAEISDPDAARRLQALLERMDNRQGFFKNVGELLLNATRRNFERESAPDGTLWAPLRPATIRARRSPGPILVDRGNLKGSSLSYEADNDEVRVGSTALYAAIHQLGGTINKAAGTRWMAGRRFAKRDKAPDGAEKAIRAHAITIPARPFLGVSAEDETAILGEAEDWLSSAF